MSKKWKVKFNDECTHRVVFGGAIAIHYSINEKLREQCKQLKREFSQEFKDWFIWMKANFDHGLASHGNKDDWWWVPAMRLQMPGIKIKGIDY